MTKKNDDTGLVQALTQHQALTTLAKDAKEQADMIRDEVILPTVRDLQIKSKQFTASDGSIVSVSFPTPSEKHVVDEDKLKKALGAAVWAKVTTPALDPVKLDAWLNEAGLPEAERLRRMTLVGAATTTKPGPKPSPRYRVIQKAEPAPVPVSTPAPVPVMVAIDLPDDI